MANPYESGGSADPFREQPRPPAGPAAQPPTATTRTQGMSPNTYGAAAPDAPYGGATYADISKSDSRSNTPTMQFYSGGGTGTPPSAAFAPPGSPAPAAPAAAHDTAVEAAAAPEPTSKFWTLAFYQQFFDINTRQVLLRLSNTLVPLNPPDFLMDRNWHFNESMGAGAAEDAALEEAGVVLSRKADLYGPFWVCTTLWMTLAVVSNVMSKIAYTKANNTTTPWKYDFTVATVSYAVIYLYCFVFGAVVWGVMQWKNLPATLTDTVCLYGYSMFIFELVAILCMIPSSVAQWIFVMIGGAWSTAYLLINMWHMWKTTLERQWFIGLVVLVSAFHMGLTLSFKFYFFNYKI